MNILLDLFLTFVKIGLFTFGGGYAMISIIEDNCVEQKGWITHDEMMNITVIAESTPGPIAINCATYTGYKKAGIMGAVAATLGMVLPSFGIIYLISIFLDNFLELTLVANAFKGIKIAVGILILATTSSSIARTSKAVPIRVRSSSRRAMTAIPWNIPQVFMKISISTITASLTFRRARFSSPPQRMSASKTIPSRIAVMTRRIPRNMQGMTSLPPTAKMSRCRAMSPTAARKPCRFW